MSLNQLLWLPAGVLRAQEAAGVETDFRVYVFGAYGAVLLLLFLFSLWSVAQIRAAERKLDQLKERLDHGER